MRRVRPEREVFAAMCEEMTTEQIAMKLGVSRAAVHSWAVRYKCEPRKLNKDGPSTAKYLPMPATPGPLRCRYLQGEAYAEAT